MRSERLHVSSKRRRIVYLQKLIIIATAAVLACCLSVCFGKMFVSAHGSQQEDPVEYRYYTSIEVHEGDSLWSIAEEYKDETYDSVEDYVAELIRINQLHSTTIHEGRYLTVSYTDSEYR